MAAHLTLKVEEFENWCGLLGHRSKAAQARFIGMDAAHLGRVLNGERGVGADLVAGVCAAFSPYRSHEQTFGALFDIKLDDSCADDEPAALAS